MATQLICDFGSCHEGKLEACEEMVQRCGDAGIWLKFQLCPKLHGNTPIDPSWLPMLVQIGRRRGTEVFASVWDEDGLSAVVDAGCKHVKFAYSARHLVDLQRDALKAGLQVYVTHGLLEWPEQIKNVHRLWIVTVDDKPVYPVTHAVIHDPTWTWAGFSCHSYDVGEITRAIEHGYEYVEFHGRLPRARPECPDGRFAINIAQLQNINEKTGGR